MTSEPILDIFATGRHTTMAGDTLAFSERDLVATAAAYNPAVYEAPLCVGHPKIDAPAYGWVSRLEVRDGHLFAAPSQVDPQFQGMVQEGRFKKISAAFFSPTSKDNPMPGVWYLRHVGFLGAAAPAVKGLKPAQFAAGGDVVVFGDPHDQREAELLAREADVAAREAELSRGRRHGEDALFAEQLVREARLPASMRGEVVELLRVMDDERPVAFSAPLGEDGETVQKTPAQAFRDMLAKLPTMVMFGAVKVFDASGPTSDGGGTGASFAAPSGYAIDASNADLDRRAREFQAKHGGTYSAAVRAVSGNG